MVEKYGEGNWARIAKELGKKGFKRTGPQCGTPKKKKNYV